VAAPAMRVVERALLDHRVVRLDYEDKHGNVTRGRRVEPLGFMLGERHTYLHGWCRLRAGPRAFRLDRIHRATITAEPAGTREPADLDCDLPPGSRHATIAIGD
jgi:predicted DNA-binding transcriptional regulator YafY